VAAIRRFSGIVLALACLVLPCTAAAEVNSIWIAPAAGGDWDLAGSRDCVEPPNILWSTITYVTLETGHAMRIKGTVHNGSGGPAKGVVVSLWYAGFRTNEFKTPKLAGRTTSLVDGSFSVRTPVLKRNTYFYATVPEDRWGESQGTCFANNWPLTPGWSGPLVVDVLPVVRIDRKKATTRGKSIVIKARLDAVDPTRAGPVRLQRRVGSKWRNEKTLRPAGSRGTMSIRISPKRKGTTQYRLLFTPKKNSQDYVVGADQRFSVTFTPPAPRRQATVTFAPKDAVTLRDPNEGTTIQCAINTTC
jgi:hypothetical protein